MDDLRFALRSLRRAPAFALTVVATIALGVSVNTAVFHLIHTVLLNPLPYRQPAQLVHLAETHPDFPTFPVSAPDFADWTKATQSYEALAAHTFDAMNKATLLDAGEPEAIQVLQATHNLFPTLGIQPLHGRWYNADDEVRKLPVAVISEALWHRKFAADPTIIGRTIRVDNQSFQVIGIVAQTHAYPAWGDLWMPFSLLDPALQETRRFHALEVVARLKPGVTISHAQSEINTLATRLGQAHPATNATVGAVVSPLAGWITGEVRPTLLLAWAAVALVLLLACANVAHFVLVRTRQRSQELAIRAALGAGALRTARLLLTENAILAAAGGLLGAVLAHSLIRLAPADIPRLTAAPVAPETLAFAALSTLLCTALFALPALLHARRADIRESRFEAPGRARFGALILAAELALAFAVITGAGLLYRSYETLLAQPPGFNPNNLIAAEIFDTSDFQSALFPRLRQLAGVTSVAAANLTPTTLGPRDVSRYSTRYGIQGRSYPDGQFPVAQIRWTTPDYFQTLEIPLLSGHEPRPGQPGAVINQALARRMFPGQDPLSQTILMNVVTPTPNAIPIVGVAADVRDLALDVDPLPAIYVLGLTNTMTLFVRGASLPELRATLRAARPQDPLRLLAPLDDVVNKSLARRRLALQLLAVFAALAMLLTAIGVFGIVSYSFSQRRQEFAIRLALGAARRHLLQLVLSGYSLALVAGLALGVWLAWLFAGILRTQLYQLSPADPRTYTATAVVLALLVLAAALRPSAQAARNTILTR